MSDAGVNAASWSEDGKTITTQDVLDKEPTSLEVPLRELEDTSESIVLGFRQSMVSFTDKEGNGGEVLCGAGLGTDWIILQWKDGSDERSAVLRGSEILKHWLATFKPEIADKFPETIK